MVEELGVRINQELQLVYLDFLNKITVSQYFFKHLLSVRAPFLGHDGTQHDDNASAHHYQ